MEFSDETELHSELLERVRECARRLHFFLLSKRYLKCLHSADRSGVSPLCLQRSSLLLQRLPLATLYMLSELLVLLRSSAV